MYNDSKKMSKFIDENIRKREEKYLGECPDCKVGKVTENAKAFGCNKFKEGCKFTIWKNSSITLFQKFGIAIDEEYLKEIIKSALNGEPLLVQSLKLKDSDKGSKIELEKKDKGWGLKIIGVS
jgi:hypothetical protein